MTLESIGTLVVGAIIGFFASILKDWLMENRKDKDKTKQLKREKLEEIFILLGKVYKNAINPIELFDDTIDTGRFGMLVRFYFPELYTINEEFLLVLTEINRVKIDNALQKINNFDENLISDFHEKVRKYFTEITAESKKYI